MEDDFDPDAYLASLGGGQPAAAPAAPMAPVANPYAPAQLFVRAPSAEESFDPDAYLASIRPQTSGIESAIRGAAQGGTLGFADEITGALEAAFTPKTYRQARDESRAAYRQAQEDNPLAFGAGEVGGGLASLLLPGGAAAKGASLAGKVGAAALGGAVSGAGYSEEESLGGIARDAAVSGAVSGGLAGALGLAAKGVGKLAKGYAAKAPERFERHLAEDISEGATPTARKRLAQLQPGMLAEVIGEDKALQRTFRDPAAALAAVKERVDQLVTKPKPIYDVIDKAAGKIKLRDVMTRFNDEIKKAAADPGMDAWAELLRKKQASFANAARAATGTKQGGANVDLDTHFLRRWVTNVGKEADTTLGSLGETERFAIKSRMHDFARGILDDRLDAAEKIAPGLGDVIGQLRQVNRKLATFAKVEEVLESRELRERIGAKNLAQYLNGQNLMLLAGLAGGSMSPAPLIAGVAARGALAGGRALNRAATAKLAALVRAGRSGQSIQKAIEDALAAGIPEPMVRAITGGARTAASTGET